VKVGDSGAALYLVLRVLVLTFARKKRGRITPRKYQAKLLETKLMGEYDWIDFQSIHEAPTIGELRM